jgi:predicted DCC family thiol-disulfide oxidoreductase YuxK
MPVCVTTNYNNSNLSNMKQNNHVLVYDDTCPMCALYSGAFVKTGLLCAEGRQAFSNADTKVLAAIDLQRGKNEIPLLDKATQQVYYGIDALLEILGQKLPWVKTVGNWRPVKWFLYRLYRLITYNRRVIVAPAARPGTFDCTPDFNTRYRIYFLVLCLLLNTLLIGPLHPVLANSVFGGLSYGSLLLGHGLLVVFNTMLLAGLPRQTGLEYLGQVNMLATLFFLLCLPLLWANQLGLATGPLFNTVYIGALGGLIGREYVRRMQYAGIWQHHRWVVLADVASMIGFFVLITY